MKAVKIKGRKTLRKVDKIDLSFRDLEGNTALHWAVEMGSVECVKRIIHYGFDVNQLNNHGQAPLHKVCSNTKNTSKNGEIIRLLVRSSAMDVPDAAGRKPSQLIAATGNSDAEALSMLASLPEIPISVAARIAGNDRTSMIAQAYESGEPMPSVDQLDGIEVAQGVGTALGLVGVVVKTAIEVVKMA